MSTSPAERNLRWISGSSSGCSCSSFLSSAAGSSLVLNAVETLGIGALATNDCKDSVGSCAVTSAVHQHLVARCVTPSLWPSPWSLWQGHSHRDGEQSGYYLCGKEDRCGGQAGLQVVQRRLAQRQRAAGEVQHIVHHLRQSSDKKVVIKMWLGTRRCYSTAHSSTAIQYATLHMLGKGAHA